MPAEEIKPLAESTQQTFLKVSSSNTKLKPFCVDSLSEHNINNYSKNHPLPIIHRMLEHVPPLEIHNLTPFLLFPMVKISKESSNVLIIEHVIEITLLVVQKVYSATKASRETVDQLLMMLPVLGLDKQLKSEELKMNICKILEVVVKRSELTAVYRKPILAHNVAMLLDFLNTAPFHRLSLASTQVLIDLLNNINSEM
jgi:hypothetical protein